MVTFFCDTRTILYRLHAMHLRSKKVDTTSTSDNKMAETKFQTKDDVHYDDVIITKYVF